MEIPDLPDHMRHVERADNCPQDYEIVKRIALEHCDNLSLHGREIPGYAKDWYVLQTVRRGTNFRYR